MKDEFLRSPKDMPDSWDKKRRRARPKRNLMRLLIACLVVVLAVAAEINA
jgi:hypothetical protein